MTNASASNTAIDKSRTRDPSLQSPGRFQRTDKAPGSLVLKWGRRWFEVQPDGTEVEVAAR